MEFTPQIYAVGGIVVVLLCAVFYFARTSRTKNEFDPRAVVRDGLKLADAKGKQYTRHWREQIEKGACKGAGDAMKQIMESDLPDARKAGDNVDV